MYYDVIIIYFIITYVHGRNYKHHTIMKVIEISFQLLQMGNRSVIGLHQ